MAYSLDKPEYGDFNLVDTIAWAEKNNKLEPIFVPYDQVRNEMVFYSVDYFKF